MTEDMSSPGVLPAAEKEKLSVGDIEVDGNQEWVITGMAVQIGELHYTRVKRNSLAHKVMANTDERLREALGG